MASNATIPTLERPSFFDGQRLTADDLGDVQTFLRELRWLHNRALHNWGIAFGYAVNGIRGGREVTLQPGYAIDCKGRDLILGQSMTMPIPAVSGTSSGGPKSYYLTATYAEDEDLVPETRQGSCNTSGAVRYPETPLIRWRDPNDRSPDSGFRHGIDIVLGAIAVQNCMLAEDVSGAERRDALPEAQPYIAAGNTEAGETAWRLWPNDEKPVGVATTVVTAAAGFRNAPRYHAHVVGKRVYAMASNEGRGVVDGYTQIAQATAASFDLRMILPAGVITESAILNPPEVLTPSFIGALQDPTKLGWHVVWMGIEG
jgi:hypothetical protein